MAKQKKDFFNRSSLGELKETAAALGIEVASKTNRKDISDAIIAAPDSEVPEAFIEKDEEENPIAAKYRKLFVDKSVFWVGDPIEGMGVAMEDPADAAVYAFHGGVARMAPHARADAMERAYRALDDGGQVWVFDQCTAPGFAETLKLLARPVGFYDFNFLGQLSDSPVGVWKGTKILLENKNG